MSIKLNKGKISSNTQKKKEEVVEEKRNQSYQILQVSMMEIEKIMILIIFL